MILHILSSGRQGYGWIYTERGSQAISRHFIDKKGPWVKNTTKINWNAPQIKDKGQKIYITAITLKIKQKFVKLSIVALHLD